VKLTSPAKINIGLRLLNRRPDGYHELESFFHTLAWGDEIELEPASAISLETEIAPDAPHPELFGDIPTGEENLAWRAAAEALGAAGREGISIRLRKRIPPGAGLGGGSSNAAAVMQGIFRLYGTEPDRSAVIAMAAGIGADVPFFLTGGCALVEGIGEQITPAGSLSDTSCLLILHPFAVSTARAYRMANYTLTRDPEYGHYLNSHGDLGPILSRVALYNDLQNAVVKAHPEIAASVAALEHAGAYHASMTGSGSAVYGLFDSEEESHRAMSRLAVSGGVVVETTLR
jgi:4-diphosphocytidyl-2-C-methyl-D-erythritol kinase